jgi:hypothetical protein
VAERREPDWLDPIPHNTKLSTRPELVLSLCIKKGKKKKKGKEIETKEQHQHMMKLPASGFPSDFSLFSLTN